MISPKFLPCACDFVDHFKRLTHDCWFVRYEPQEIAKGERLAKEQGLEGVIVYKICFACFVCKPY